MAERVSKADLSAHLISSACSLRARDELLQAAMARVRKKGSPEKEDWLALAQACEASLRIPAQNLIMVATHIDPDHQVQPTVPGRESSARMVLRSVLLAFAEKLK